MKPRKGKFIDLESFNSSGLSVDEIMQWEDDRDAFNKFLSFLDKYVDKYDKVDKIILCGYNSLYFDVRFLYKWFSDNENKYFNSYFWGNSIDVLSEATRYLIQYRPVIKNFKLSSVAKALDISVDEDKLHDGLYDMKLTYKIFEKILNLNFN